MQLIINISLHEPCELPLSYHHMLQAVIYRLMAEDGEYSELHNEGFHFEKRTYKLFSFSLLKGHYQIVGKHIIFDDRMSFEVRCFDEEKLFLMQKNLLAQGIEFCGKKYADVSCELKIAKIKSKNIIIKMLSPICVYSTERETKKTIFYTPWDEEFSELVNENFKRKYIAAIGEDDSLGEIDIEPYRVSQKDKYVTKYKSFTISGWNGFYKLSGDADALNFLYHTGLGAKNSQGFGMFEVVDDDSH